MKKRRVLTVTVGVLVLSAGLMLMSVNRGAQAAPPASNPGNPFQAILDKLDQVQAAITGAAGQSNHTLRWDTSHASATRFTVLAAIPGAVLDNNTGLVWEQAPDGSPRPWLNATTNCVNKKVPATGGTKGWRLPSVVELASVQDPSLPAPFVPASVFTFSSSDSTPGVRGARYWSASSLADAAYPAHAWGVAFDDGVVNATPKADANRYWCVRGGMNADAY